MAIQRDNAERIREAIHFRDAFRIASMSGEPKRPGNRIAMNRLPIEHADSVTAAEYVVYSYATAIAWWSEDDGWTVPDVYHSVTTSNHQGIAKVGIEHGRLS